MRSDWEYTCNDYDQMVAEFDLYDTDNSGTISESEFWAGYACMHCSYTYLASNVTPFDLRY